MWLVHDKDSDKVPFEDCVRDYLLLHNGQNKTYGDCMRDLGIGAAAILLALASLERKGVVEKTAP